MCFSDMLFEYHQERIIEEIREEFKDKDDNPGLEDFEYKDLNGKTVSYRDISKETKKMKSKDINEAFDQIDIDNLDDIIIS